MIKDFSKVVLENMFNFAPLRLCINFLFIFISANARPKRARQRRAMVERGQTSRRNFKYARIENLVHFARRNAHGSFLSAG